MGVEEQFEYLAAGYERKSDPSVNYNCIAFAASRQDKWWWPIAAPGTHPYWPPGAPRQATLSAFEAAFKTLGYETCADYSLQPGIEKIAIYAIGTTPTHAARQRADGRWLSKLGKGIDIAHALFSLNGNEYGVPVLYMQRPRTIPAPKKSSKKKRRR